LLEIKIHQGDKSGIKQKNMRLITLIIINLCALYCVSQEDFAYTDGRYNIYHSDSCETQAIVKGTFANNVALDTVNNIMYWIDINRKINILDLNTQVNRKLFSIGTSFTFFNIAIRYNHNNERLFYCYSTNSEILIHSCDKNGGDVVDHGSIQAINANFDITEDYLIHYAINTGEGRRDKDKKSSNTRNQNSI